MKENIKGFWNLIVLILSCNMCFAGVQEIPHQLVLKNYTLALGILLLTIYFIATGVDSYGCIKEQLKK